MGQVRHEMHLEIGEVALQEVQSEQTPSTQYLLVFLPSLFGNVIFELTT